MAYLESLRRVHDLGPAALYCGHGPELTEDAGAVLDFYLAHRAYRERQLLAALAGGPATVDELVAAVYAEVPRDLWPAAAQSTRATLAKLTARAGSRPPGTLSGWPEPGSAVRPAGWLISVRTAAPLPRRASRRGQCRPLRRCTRWSDPRLLRTCRRSRRRWWWLGVGWRARARAASSSASISAARRARSAAAARRRARSLGGGGAVALGGGSEEVGEGVGTGGCRHVDLGGAGGSGGAGAPAGRGDVQGAVGVHGEHPAGCVGLEPVVPSAQAHQVLHARGAAGSWLGVVVGGDVVEVGVLGRSSAAGESAVPVPGSDETDQRRTGHVPVARGWWSEAGAASCGGACSGR